MLPYHHATTPPCYHATMLPCHLAPACLCPSDRLCPHLIVTPQLEDRIRSTEVAPSRSGRPQRRSTPSSSYRQRSRSRSPPPRSQTRQAPSRRETNQSFQRGASSSAMSACAVCLSRQKHQVHKCAATKFWSGDPARCTRNDRGRLINPDGAVICGDFQKTAGCASSDGTHKHECSGCGQRSHGAQACPLAEAA
jgi:hypothetical protein